MTATRDCPSAFRGVSYSSTEHYVLVKAEAGSHEVLVPIKNVLHTTSRPYQLNGTGMAQLREEGWCWTPDKN